MLSDQELSFLSTTQKTDRWYLYWFLRNDQKHFAPNVHKNGQKWPYDENWKSTTLPFPTGGPYRLFLWFPMLYGWCQLAQFFLDLYPSYSVRYKGPNIGSNQKNRGGKMKDSQKRVLWFSHFRYFLHDKHVPWAVFSRLVNLSKNGANTDMSSRSRSKGQMFTYILWFFGNFAV